MIEKRLYPSQKIYGDRITRALMIFIDREPPTKGMLIMAITHYR